MKKKQKRKKYNTYKKAIKILEKFEYERWKKIDEALIKFFVN